MRIFLFLVVVITFFCVGRFDTALADTSMAFAAQRIPIPLVRPHRSDKSLCINGDPSSSGGPGVRELNKGQGSIVAPANKECSEQLSSTQGKNRQLQQSGIENKDASSASSLGDEKGHALSDPLTIARFVVTPILLWILKNLVSYSFRRIHIARTIYVDVEYQLRFLDRAVEGLTKWLNGLSQKPPVVPYLRLSPDRHYVYPSIQEDILECMWGEEITAVRFFYRDMEQVERHAEKIAASAHAIYALPPANLLNGRTAKMRYDADLKRGMEAIRKNLEALSRVKEFWVETVGRSTDQKNPFRGAASQLLYRLWVWHPIFTIAPAVLILLTVGALFWGAYLYSLGLEYLPWLFRRHCCVYCSFLIVGLGGVCLLMKRSADKRIFGAVTQRYINRASG